MPNCDGLFPDAVLQATDWDRDHVDLEWSAPKQDGGSPISKYIIEKKPKYGWVLLLR